MWFSRAKPLAAAAAAVGTTSLWASSDQRVPCLWKPTASFWSQSFQSPLACESKPVFKGTPHINAEAGAFAETVLLPGDPARAEWIAKNFLQDVVEVTNVRRISGYTGTYKGKRISVMATGMGCPSMTIYATELIKSYGVKNLIRIGTCGAGHDDVKIGDLVFAVAAGTDSSMRTSRFSTSKGVYQMCPVADFQLLRKGVEHAEKMGVNYKVGPVFTVDHFYHPDDELNNLLWANGIMGVEMEAAALFDVAAQNGCRAMALCTVTDHLVRHEAMPSDQRQTSLKSMVTVGLEVAIAA